MDHIVDIMVSHHHPVVLVGSSAQRWMGSAGALSRICDLLIKNSGLQSIGKALIQSGHWKKANPKEQLGLHEVPESEADIFLQRTKVEDENEYEYLCLWSETTYHINVDTCPFVEVPDFYPWFVVLIEEKWHPAIGREDGWWYGPRLCSETKLRNLSEGAVAARTFSERFPRGKSPSNNHPILVPSLPAYLDALVFQATHYRESKQELALFASWIIRNLVRYLYLELPHQQLPLLIELEEDDYMEEYLRDYKRKPFFVYQEGVGTQVHKWDPASYPDWCKARAQPQSK
ncbi:hypothetical protein C7974DRAFT_442602 [Boeremia exigua]|uniref:uncharacterized protein n=1 Tax=Boeremia exigua TaxID=749465 RepID=UPI001E8EECD2|nr:uncharacterized protein C7974DRAFT_442602 [Boeremia exigua]KAH6616793.1 hypothetical protein C7974DRAFT_442602 [Boeremia exigua]